MGPGRWERTMERIYKEDVDSMGIADEPGRTINNISRSIRCAIKRRGASNLRVETDSDISRPVSALWLVRGDEPDPEWALDLLPPDSIAARLLRGELKVGDRL